MVNVFYIMSIYIYIYILIKVFQKIATQNKKQILHNQTDRNDKKYGYHPLSLFDKHGILWTTGNPGRLGRPGRHLNQCQWGATRDALGEHPNYARCTVRWPSWL